MRNKLELPKGTKIPNHVAIIPDGNRRWARARGLHTLVGHKRGAKRGVELGRAARDLGVHTVTLWGFSTENWDRKKTEVNYLMKLYEELIDDYYKEAKENKVRIVHLGRKERLPRRLLKKIEEVERETKNLDKYVMNIALDYGGRDDIIRAIRKVIDSGISSDQIDEKFFSKYLDTYDQPYPYVDLMIRTSGEQRVSGFLLWQSEYCEYYWERDHFPDFEPQKLKDAILDYSRRRRRFGGNDAVEHLRFRPEVAARLEVAWWRLQNIPEGARFIDYSIEHIKEQFGLSKNIAKEAALYLTEAVLARNGKRNWKKVRESLIKFYQLIRDELKLAFEPSIVASMEVKLWQEMEGKQRIEMAQDVEDIAKNLYAEVYRISLFQAAKLAHLRVLAKIESNLAERGLGDHHWDRAEDYLQKFYTALKERVA